MAQVGGTANYNREIARNPSASSHRASPVRTAIMQRLGLQTPGFWADWAKRRISPQAQEAYSPYAQITTPQLSKIPQYKSQIYDSTPTTPTDLDIKPYKSHLLPGAGAGPTPKGNARENLIKAQKAVLSGTIKFNIQSHPSLSTTVMDTMTAEAINMDRQMSMMMEDTPGMVMSQAAAKFYAEHPQASAANVMETNFEKQTSMYSETQKKAAKRQGYAAAENNKKIDKARRNPVPSAPTYNSPILNIGKGTGYTSSVYLSPFG